METVEVEEIIVDGHAVGLVEVNRQEYGDCTFSSGFVQGHPHDTVYLRAIREDGTDDWLILLRPDELVSIAWLATGTLWSGEMSRLMESHLVTAQE